MCGCAEGHATKIVEGAVSPDTSHQAKSSQLSKEAEEELLAFFSLQDTPSKDDVLDLAVKVIS